MKDANIDYSLLRPKKAASLKHWDEHVFQHHDKVGIWRGTDATILPLVKFPQDSLGFGRAGVVDAEGNYVESSAIPSRVQGAYPVENLEYRDERVIYCGYWVKQWGHFLVESVARMWYALESADKLVFVTDNGDDSVFYGNYREFFELLGVYDRIEILNKPVKYREVIVPELAYKWRRGYSDQYKKVFAHIAQRATAPAGWEPADKIFLSRSKLKNISRIESGNDMLDDFFSRNGYTVLHPQDISLAELVMYLNNCKECASVSGTLPHNMLFAPDNSKLTIIERNVMNNEIQLDINKMKYLNVTYVDANLAVYPVGVSYGPFVLAYNDKLEKFAMIRNYQAPNAKYLSSCYYKKCFCAYMKAYRKAYHYQWHMAEWMIEYSDYLYEAYRDSLKYFGDYVNGIKPFKVCHYFMPHYWKGFARRLLSR